MIISDIQKRMRFWYEGRLSIHLEGMIGCGKTSMLATAAKLMSDATGKSFGFVPLNGPLLYPPEIIGHLALKHFDDGHSESIYSDPFFWRTPEGKRLEEYDGGGFIVVDEIDKAELDTKKIIGESQLSGRFGQFKLPDTWRVWTAGNTKDHRSGSTKELDHHINRRTRIPMEPDFGSWHDNFAIKFDVMPISILFAENHKHIVFANSVPEQQGAFCTVRSFTQMDGYLRKLMQLTNVSNIPDDACTFEECVGTVGMAAADAYFQYVKLKYEAPETKAIIENPGTVRIPDRADIQMLVVYNLAHDVTEENAGAIITYIDRMPKDYAVTFLKAATIRKPTLIKCMPFIKWLARNTALVGLVGQL